MKNYKITAKEDNKEYWVSRSCAVAVFVFTHINNRLCVLANKRGKGTPDCQGLWNCPCGYLDWDETTEEAAKREVLEETGYLIEKPLKLSEVRDSLNNNHQNIIFRYFTYVYHPNKCTPVGGEDDEVEEVKWIPVDEISNYQWTFNHEHTISKLWKLILI